LRAYAIALCLIPALAFGDDPGRLYQPPAPEMVGYPNWVLTPDGKARIDARLERYDREVFQLRVENSSLRTDVEEMAKKPALTFKGAAILVGVGLVLGLAVGVPIAIAVRR
jgi:hypothetical protein